MTVNNYGDTNERDEPPFSPGSNVNRYAAQQQYAQHEQYEPQPQSAPVQQAQSFLSGALPRRYGNDRQQQEATTASLVRRAEADLNRELIAVGAVSTMVDDLRANTEVAPHFVGMTRAEMLEVLISACLRLKDIS